MKETDLIQALEYARWDAAPGSFTAQFVFKDQAAFAGHFPGNPLLPGAFQLEMVRLVLEKLTAQRYAIAQVPRAKFTAEVHPGDPLQIQGRVDNTGPMVQVQATLSVGSVVAATMSLNLIPAGVCPPGSVPFCPPPASP
jgi:3-hydroxyacyl-[acyl-carrier-protein] dehydratase